MGASPRARFTPRARADLDEIWRYTFGRWSLDQADRYHQAIVDAAGELATGAKAGRAVEIRAGYLKYAVGSHLIFNRRTDAGIDVVRVLHQRMDVPSRLSCSDLIAVSRVIWPSSVAGAHQVQDLHAAGRCAPKITPTAATGPGASRR